MTRKHNVAPPQPGGNFSSFSLGARTAILFAVLLMRLPLSSVEKITLPGTVDQICLYSQFFYNYPEQDFIPYLNDRLLFLEPPDNNIYLNNWRFVLGSLVTQHERIKDYMAKNSLTGQGQRITFDLRDPDQAEKARAFAGLLGLNLSNELRGGWKVSAAGDDPLSYYLFARLEPGTLENQIGRTLSLGFELKETKVEIPWDFRFLSDITGLEVNTDSFLKLMLRNKPFSLLLGILFRLSDREIAYISALGERPGDAWKTIFHNKKLLIGFFLLAHALRVRDNRLIMPGGQEAEAAWSALAGASNRDEPLTFLLNLASRDEGKLNYLYLFSYFLPDEKLRALLFGFDVQKMSELYGAITLEESERLKANAFPRINPSSFYSLLYLLQVKNGSTHFPGGIAIWRQAIAPSPPAAEGVDETLDFLKALLSLPRGGRKDYPPLRIFTALYAKFYDRPELLNQESLSALYQNYENANVLVDFLEKIPFRSPASVTAALNWWKRFQFMEKNQKAFFSAICQALLEIIAQAAHFGPGRWDADRLLSRYWLFVMNHLYHFDDLVGFIETLNPTRQRGFSPLDFVVAGLQPLEFKVNQVEYLYDVKESFRHDIEEILQSQDICPYTTFPESSALLKRIESGSSRGKSEAAVRMREILRQLPYPEFSEQAPAPIRGRVLAYDQTEMLATADRLVRLVDMGDPARELPGLIQKIRAQYLLPQLKDYLVALAYALNAKSPELKAFQNSNFSRLHDFEESGNQGPWNYCGRPEGRRLLGFHLKGGLSRLDLGLAAAWKDQIFGNRIIYNHEYLQALLANILAQYPLPQAEPQQSRIAASIDAALDLMEKSKSDRQLAGRLAEWIARRTTGFHYRKAQNYLDGKEPDYRLFWSEMATIGDCLPDLVPNGRISGQYMRWNGARYQTWGNLLPRADETIPQDLAVFIAANPSGGEMFSEGQAKVSYHAAKQGYPPEIMGQLLLAYTQTECRKYYSQNSPKDYESAHFVFDVMNPFHLREIMKRIQSRGGVKVK